MKFKDYLNADDKEVNEEVKFDIDAFVKDGSIKKAESEISKQIQALIGTKVDIKLSVKNDKLIAESGNIKHSPKIFKELKIGEFNTGPAGDGTYWLVIKYLYKHFDGGSNASDIATFWLKQNGTIKGIRTDM